MITNQIALWGGFTLFIFGMLALDLGVFQKKSHVITMKEAMTWFAVWTGLALLFNVGILFFHPRGGEAGIEFLTGYLVEKSLSIDNIFVFLLIFNFFRVPQPYQHKVLFWGIVGAIFLRIAFIVAGISLLQKFHWTIYIFGGFLLLTGISMLRRKEANFDPGEHKIVRLFRRFFPVSDRFDSDYFFTKKDGRWIATPLFLVLLMVESSDIIFAVDSIPAIFSITGDPFIVYTSNIFAMLGLRALYFAVAGFMRMFHFLHYGFASIIIILGVKMLISDFYHVPVDISLMLILVILLLCIIISLLRPRQADLKSLFERTERLGLMPFRRLLLIENIVDLAELKIRDAMRTRSGAKVIELNRPWSENLELIQSTRFTRYPVIEESSAPPIGILHLKDLALMDPHPSALSTDLLRRLARPAFSMRDDLPLEEALTRFQSTYNQMAMVTNAKGDWVGIISIEDILEELVGKIRDEFDISRDEQSIPLADTLSPEQIVFGVQGATLHEAVKHLLESVPASQLPAPPETIIAAVQARENIMPTYLGSGLAIPHCRLEQLDQPLLFFGRSDEGIPVETSNDRVTLIFVLLTPSKMARIQPRLLADIVGLIESDYVTERLQKATSASEVIEAICAGQQVSLD